MPRDPIFPLRLDDERKAIWQKAADAAGLSLSEWVRAAGDARAAGPPAGRPIIHLPGEEAVPEFSARRGGLRFRGPDPKPQSKPKPKRGRT